MKKKNRKWSVLLVIAASAVAVLFFISSLVPGFLDEYSTLIGSIAIGLFLIVFLIVIFSSTKQLRYINALENRLGMWNTISYEVKGAGETAFNELPIGIIVLDKDNNIVWSNASAKQSLRSSLDDMNLADVANGLVNDFILKATNSNENTTDIEIYSHVLHIEYLVKYNVLYFHDVTEHSNLQKEYNKHITCFGYINIDNFEEGIADLDAQEKSIYMGSIISIITSWSSKYNAYVRPLSDSKFIIITDNEHLDLMRKDNFSILDDVRVMIIPSKSYSITLSIGIACLDETIDALSEVAQEKLEMALNRGGDQVVIQLFDKLEFHGAKSEPIRKESKVDVRFKYEQLERLINSSSKVFCIPHKLADSDAFASAVAAYKLAIAHDKESYIIINENDVDNTVKKIIADITKFNSPIKDAIISIDRALQIRSDSSLLLVCDCQSLNNLSIDSKQLRKFKNIGIIDHHRRNESGVIENAKFFYAEPSASSSVEVMFSLFEFCNKDLKINSLEATWMLLGIVVDTNNFVYRTSSVTFDVASKLHNLDANISMVQNYLKEEQKEKLIRNKLIQNIERYRDVVAISVQKDDSYLEGPVIAKVSDELLTIEGIELAVTIAYTNENTIRLSARSLGSINCQVLMEHLGGGGHLSGAACEIHDKTKEEILKELKLAIDSVLNDTTDKQKEQIILSKDIRNLGTRGQIVTIPSIKAKQLIDNGDAFVATTENIRIIEQQKEEKFNLEQREHQLKLDKKAIVEAEPLQIKIQKEKDGSFKLSKIKKEISLLINQKFEVLVDETRIMINQEIVSYGNYTASIEIFDELVAEVKLYIID